MDDRQHPARRDVIHIWDHLVITLRDGERETASLSWYRSAGRRRWAPATSRCSRFPTPKAGRVAATLAGRPASATGSNGGCEPWAMSTLPWRMPGARVLRVASVPGWVVRRSHRGARDDDRGVVGRRRRAVLGRRRGWGVQRRGGHLGGVRRRSVRVHRASTVWPSRAHPSTTTSGSRSSTVAVVSPRRVLRGPRDPGADMTERPA